MSKKKRKHIPRGATSSRDRVNRSASQDVITGDQYPTEEIKWYREAIEGLVVAIVLALLIRGFEAEAFVIPTGSMATALRGRHKDVLCEQCGKEYAVGNSLDSELREGEVIATVCPICAFPQDLKFDKGRDASFSGDRILVNKFAFDPLGEPERFDVIVFKNPNDAKQNYIKRLCGLPGESLVIKRGDIFVRPLGDTGRYTIARKPPRKLRTLLQIVDDTKHVSPALLQSGMPPRWQPDPQSGWQANETHQQFELQSNPNESWLRFRNYVPTYKQWENLKNGRPVSLVDVRPSLISDTYAYNSYRNEERAPFPAHSFNSFLDRYRGKNWVGDLAVEAEMQVESDSGNLLFDLVEAGWRFRCSIDVATGKAELSVRQPNGQLGQFLEKSTVAGSTNVRGSGSYEVLFSNIDSELRLWIDNELVTFDSTTCYLRDGTRDEFDEPLRPVYGGPENPGDLAPVGVGGAGIQMRVNRLRVHRDVYYVAVTHDKQRPADGDYTVPADYQSINELFRTPELWENIPLFDRMKIAKFDLEDSEDDALDQFFPMGDNSPHSADARIWEDHYVQRQYLIGEAVFIYYPHPWHVKLPGEKFKTLPLFVYPKFSRMGVIR